MNAASGEPRRRRTTFSIFCRANLLQAGEINGRDEAKVFLQSANEEESWNRHQIGQVSGAWPATIELTPRSRQALRTLASR